MGYYIHAYVDTRQHKYVVYEGPKITFLDNFIGDHFNRHTNIFRSSECCVNVNFARSIPRNLDFGVNITLLSNNFVLMTSIFFV